MAHTNFRNSPRGQQVSIPLPHVAGLSGGRARPSVTGRGLGAAGLRAVVWTAGIAPVRGNCASPRWEAERNRYDQQLQFWRV
ncbi:MULTISPECIES: hypothetical protein [Acetobacter]|uniref:hypothetical protein n=1 Tax=Acetobacter TaxID=434 RepID=UPI00376F6C5E